MDSPMRRTIVMALLGALLLAPPRSRRRPRSRSSATARTTAMLQGNYTAAELRDARSNLPDRPRRVLRLPRRALARDRGQDVVAKQRRQRRQRRRRRRRRQRQRRRRRRRPAAPAPAEHARRAEHGRGSQRAELDRRLPTAAAGLGRDPDARRPASTSPTLKPLSPGAARLTADVGRNGLPGRWSPCWR